MAGPTNLEVFLAGKTLRNPIGVAPHAAFAPPGIDPDREIELLWRYVDEGVGFVYTPVIRPELHHPEGLKPTGSFQLARTSTGRQGFYAIADRERIQNRLSSGTRLIETLKRRLPSDVPVIANLMVSGEHASDPARWAWLAAKVEEAGADLIELNPSCPVPSSSHDGTAVVPYSLTDYPETVAEIIEAVSERVSVPVGVKLSGELGFAQLVNSVGKYCRTRLSFVTVINSPIGIAPPDIHRRGRGKYPGISQNPFAPVVGPWIRFICYRDVAAISKYYPSLQVAAVGGLVDPEHVVEAIMLGATAVELSSGIFFHGTKFISRCIKFLQEFMEKHGYKSVTEFRGLALPYITAVSQVDWALGRFVARIDEEKCNSCGICERNLCFAIVRRRGKPEVTESDCGACGLCVAICPRHAVDLVPIT